MKWIQFNAIRTRLILLMLGIGMLPLLPMAWLVNNLVEQSYRVGINPRIEQVLEHSVDFSRQLYQLRKQQLLAILQGLPVERGNAGDTSSSVAGLPPDGPDWHYLHLAVYDSRGRLLWHRSRTGTPAARLRAFDLERLQRNSGPLFLMADRTANRFVVARRQGRGPSGRMVVLEAALPASFLQASEQTLQAYQMYRALALKPHSIPKSILETFLAFSLVILGIALGIALWLSNRLTRPLNDLVQATHQLGQGNLDYRVPVRGRDELGQLSRLFNRMASQLKASRERSIYLEKMAAWREIARRLAHEIKNPLTPIQLMVQEMVDRYPGSDAEYTALLAECSRIIHEELENLRKLVREFSEFARLPSPQRQPTDVNVLVKEVCRLFPDQAFELNLAPEVPLLQLDPGQMHRVLVNLIQNAIQASPEPQPIAITTARQEESMVITVRDYGPGIPVEIRDNLFQPYVSTRAEGMGLGLAICRTIIEEHGGEIGLEDVAGPGACFRIRLPLQSPQPKGGA